MEWDDIVYIAILFSCIAFGKYYREIACINTKKCIGTLVGIAILLIVSGLHFIHALVSTFVCALIIKLVDKRSCHIICFVFMFSYLLFFRLSYYFGLSTPPSHTNLIQMILTLKIVGLAFEINSFYLNDKKVEESNKQRKYEASLYEDISVLDIFHYSFNYIGILTGPYYRYRTFSDYLNFTSKYNPNCLEATLRKLSSIPLFAGVFLLTNYIWPLSYATSTEFYEDRSVVYRLMYVWPTFLIFRMRIFIGITLSECVCTMAGFGAYPIEAKSRAGCGPTEAYVLEESIGSNKIVEYDFETIHNIDAYSTDTCITFREAMKNWNMCVQYWLAVNIYKRVPIKPLKVFATLFVSALWHGVYSGYYLCILGAPFYLPIEDLYNSLFRVNATGLSRRIIDVLFWISKFFVFSYLGIAFLLMTLDKIWYYYSSIYHLGYIYLAVLFAVGLVIKSQRKTKKTN